MRVRANTQYICMYTNTYIHTHTYVYALQVRCMEGKLEGATLSDNGFPIIAMFFDLPNGDELSLARERAFQATEPKP